MLKLAKLLHYKGFHITFVNTEFNHSRLLRSRGPDSMNGLPDFRFESIPDGLPSSDENATQNIREISEASREGLLGPFNDMLDKLNGTESSDVPPVTCIVSDGFMPVAIDAAAMHEVPIALFFTISACSFMGFRQFQALTEKGLTPLKDESFLTNGYLDEVVDWIPGMRDIKLRDLPSFVRTTDPNDCMFSFCADCAERASEGSAVILHTFDTLEQGVLNALYSMFPRVYAIGPLQLLLNKIQEDDQNSIGCNLYTCTEWGIGMEIDSIVTREKVETQVRELMGGEEGEKMKQKAMEWRKLAEEATGPDGSSSRNLDRLVTEVLLSKK
ncbi:hypothetical protein DKX38_023517 [Salix brachista]|uniref:Uncharacterized protein n=1 Tax=Salix brachista TaxID=2182728 RepID=A0A5N5JJ39_9ROSI|nr:hypothetical protein DKX38_023517 [Salix brachista]